MRWLFVAAMLVLLLAACGSSDAESGNSDDSVATQVAAGVAATIEARGAPTSPPAVADTKESYRIQYRVTITKNKNMSLTYRNGQGGTQQEDFKGDNWISNTWTEFFTMAPGDVASISAQNGSEDGTVTCEIFLDGRRWKTAESSGGYSIASCSGSVGRD